jgi:sulfite reductase (ferredoxin)
MAKRTLENFYNKPVPSAQEQMKIDSKYLKGNIAEELADKNLAEVSDYSYELLKFHGTYQGYNRDTATARKKQGLEKENEFMVRIRLPGGRMNAQQYIAMDELATKYANNSLRMTTRQTFQFHVVAKDNLQAAIADINKAMLSTLSACGDVVRNTMASPAPTNDIQQKRIHSDVAQIVGFCAPKTTAYDELWNGKPKTNQTETAEPLYGTTYLPRKFKITIINPDDNSTDVFSHDLGFINIWEGDTHLGYNVYVGGGAGMSHEPGKDQKATYPRIASPLCFVGTHDLLNAVEAVVKFQRDYGDRTDRKHSRLKFIVEELGLDFVKAKFSEYFAATKPNEPFQEIKPIGELKIKEHLGWHEQGDGKWYLGLPTPSGRLMDYSEGMQHQSGYHAENSIYKNAKFKSCFRKLAETYGYNIALTPDHKFLICDVPEDKKAELEEFLRSYNLPFQNDLVPAMQHFHTCVALPTCAKALAESERVQFTMMNDIQARLEKFNLQNEHLAIHVTGCPNGCARPFNCDIGIVGRMPDHYVIFIGGDIVGTRLNTKVFDKVPLTDLGTALEPMFELFSQNKNEHENFGDFCNRYGVENVAAYAESKLPDYKWAKVLQ